MKKECNWVNRTSDRRSLAFQSTIIALFAFFYVISCLLFYNLDYDFGIIKSKGWGDFIGAVLGIISGGFIGFTAWGYLIFFIDPCIVPQGHLGIIQFRRAYTGEVAGPGPVMLPLGYRCEIVDCRQFTLEADQFEVRSRDGFVVKASLTAWLRVSDPLAYLTEGYSKQELTKALRSALFSAASRKNALDIVGDRDQICQQAVKELSDITTHYGLSVAKVAIDIQSIPDELTSFVQMLAILEKSFPNANPSDLIEVIMVNSGKITKNRTETTNISRLEVPGLDMVMAAAAKRFG